MKIDFNQDDQLPDGEINILVSASQLSDEVIDLLANLKNLSKDDDNWLPINTADRVQMQSIADIVGVEIYHNELMFYTTKSTYTTNGTLKDVYSKLKSHHFIQINKSAIINIDHLDYMETAFSGNMTAFLTNDLKLSISRKYLPGLKKSLRM